MYLKIHENPTGRIVAVCDKELIGQVLEDENRYLDLDRFRGFYVGEISNEEGIRKALGEFHSANIVGKKAVGIAVELGIASGNQVLRINDIPYVQIYKV